MATAKNPENSFFTVWMNNLSHSRIRLLRFATQLCFFVILNGAFLGLKRIPVPLPLHLPPGSPYAIAWGGFSAIQFILSSGQFPFFALGIFFISGALSGRIFCGWVCPVGFWQDLLDMVGSLARIPKWRINRQNDEGFKEIGQMIAVVAFAASSFFGIQRLTGELVTDTAFSRMIWDAVDPAGTLFVTWFYAIFWRIVPGQESFFSDVGSDLNFLIFTSFALVAVVILSLKVPRLYCRYLCPTGALLGYCGKASLITIKRNPLNCKDGCRECEKACPMNVPLTEFGLEGISDTSCIGCGVCVDKCPEALSFGIRI